MKKTYIFIGICACILASCQKEAFVESEGGKSEGVQISFVGDAFDATKTTIGPKDGSTYPVCWAKGDKIGIISKKLTETDTLFQNASATLYGEGGENSGVFILDEEFLVKDTQNVVIYYPQSSYTKLKTTESTMTLSNSIPMEQKQLKAGDNSYTGKYALAISTATVKPAVKEGEQYYQEPVQFTLKHSVAYIKLAISGASYSSMKLQGASIWCKGAALTGDIAVDMASGEVKNVTPRDYAVVTVEEPSALSGTQELWLVTLPADLSGKEVWVTVSMTDGTKNVSIPVKVNGGQLKANAVNVINVAVGNNTLSWYQPEEKRYLAEAYAYGPENTIMVTNADAPITFDVKARGYFIGCAQPKYVWAAVLAYGQTAPSLTVNGKKLAVVAAKNTVTAADCAEVGADGTITLDYTGTNFASGKTRMSGKIILADENLNTIWAFNLWHVGDYNDGVIAHTYKCGKVVMDRYLGAGYESHSYDNWHAMGMYFQWGRPFGFGWSGGGAYKSATTSVTDVPQSAFLAETFLTTNGVQSMSDWYIGENTNRYSDRKNDAWGNEATEEETTGSPRTGTKSVLDPCPKGWMVCSPDVLQEVMAAVGTTGFVLHTTASTATKNGEWGQYVREAEYKFGTGEGDVAYYRFDGLKWGSNAGNPTNQVNDILCVYSNSSCGSASSNCLSIYYRSKEAKWTSPGSRNSGCSVRCMKDTDNR